MLQDERGSTRDATQTMLVSLDKNQAGGLEGVQVRTPDIWRNVRLRPSSK